MHSHATVMATAVGGVIWHEFEEHSISLATRVSRYRHARGHERVDICRRHFGDYGAMGS